ncbi:hypothetical protein GPECTOR_23g119 [Gonium pectorale]|uniref:Uncharacterized protein n=1 Tax=Gonium pectorale TaxID=33097 RepID=A0A150GGR6_GONPE|nr:hypothetical protein GPECTOR_23g119 [Gonium pectorale]|eukprot:KXZ49031.1 hypothetical protein GPECTOR_23g119 [Gonium pectorale]
MAQSAASTTTLSATAASPAPPEPAGSNTFYTSPSHGSGLRGIELDRCYVGDYVAGRRHGFGTYTYPNAFFQYEGQWVNGKKHGLGKLSMRDGSYYEGEFVDGEIMGQGTRGFANGDVYIGTFEMGEMHGFGVMRLANGDTYQGPFVHNAFEGVGVYTHSNGDVFQGDFRRHKRCGQGVLNCNDGSRYEGGWVDNHRFGQGEATYPDGSWYKGAWEQSRYHGQGEWFQARPAGLTYKGLFVDGAPSLVPTHLTLTWEVEEDPKAKAKKPPAPAGARRSATGETEPALPLPVVLGEPLLAPITVAAQLLQPVRPPSQPTPAAQEGKGAKSNAKQVAAAAAAAAPARVPVLNQPPAQGFVWKTADMEWGRQVNLTLHHEPPSQLPPDRLLRALVVNTLMPDGSTRVRLLISTTFSLTPALPLCRPPAGGGGAVASLQVELASGQTVIEGHQLVIGSAEDWDRLASPTGQGYLVASTAGASVAPGLCRVALPEPRAKKPGANELRTRTREGTGGLAG